MNWILKQPYKYLVYQIFPSCRWIKITKEETDRCLYSLFSGCKYRH